MVKPVTIQLVLAMAVSKHYWPIRQLDVRNVFLHEDVYMKQPPGFTEPRVPTHVCKLQKALYGLKQAHRAWFQRFSSVLLQYDFMCSKSDTSMFVRHSSAGTIILLLYVYDIVIIVLHSLQINELISKFKFAFNMKDLSDLHYSLGMEVKRNSTSLSLT